MIRRLVKNWLQNDRIRIDPAEGRIGGLHSGDRICHRGSLYEVQSRTEVGEGAIYRVIDLANGDTWALTYQGGRDHNAELTKSEITIPVDATEIVIVKSSIGRI